ncbi:MAG: TetR/AcrR family transcriptional regulator [Oscillospiraceae bacterium]|jgi:AcrR family transcriptional regulator|nr:TetR/AcrR family transcriptional regulator [Oscillospiraceae bacterium]
MNSGNDKHVFHIFHSNYPLPIGEEASRAQRHIIVVATILFARKGYDAVSIRDIAKAIGLKPGSLYTHFESKEKLWDAVLNQAQELYMLYFKKMGEMLDKAETFEAALDIMFEEPIKMDNTFTCYAFSLIQSEQFNSDRAGRIMNDIFLGYSIRFIDRHFRRYIADGLAPPFDTATVAASFMHNVLATINASVQLLIGWSAPYDPGKMMAAYKQSILKYVQAMAT